MSGAVAGNEKDKMLLIHERKPAGFIKLLKRQKYLIVMALPAIIIVFIFNYLPIYGIIIAFKDYRTGRGIFGSSWAGIRWFEMFFSIPTAFRLFRNTFLLGFYNLLWSFPAPIIFALLLNEIWNNKFKKTIQTISYLPYFISTVIIVGMFKEMASLNGLFNQITSVLGFEPILFFGRAEWFRTLFISSNIWQGMGWGTIIYLAALSGIDTQLYEASIIDGANRWQRMVHITLPSILPTVTILLILNIGSILASDSTKVLLMYNPSTYETADIIGTYVYREGIVGARYSYATAVNLFMNVVSFVLVYFTNQISKKFSETSLW